MKNNEVIHQLQDLHFVHAPKLLHKKVAGMVDLLPEKHHGFYLPLFAFQSAFVLGVVALIVGLGSGVVVAAKESHPGTPFYSVKQLIQKVAPGIIHQESLPTPFISQPREKQQNPEEQNQNKQDKKNIEGISIPHEEQLEKDHASHIRQQKEIDDHKKGFSPTF